MSEQAKKVALITGANKGIGLETARQLGKLGITVLIGARDLGRGEKAAAELVAEGIGARALKLDVVNAADVKAAVAWVEKEYGVLDILVNNAGVMTESMGENTTSSVSEKTLRDTFEANLFSVVLLTQAFLPLVKKSAAGRIVNVSSILGSLTLHATPGSPIHGVKTFAYNTSKAALNSFTIHLADELKDTKIKVNSAHPGWVKTDLGTDAAPMDVVDGAKTEVTLATLPDDGPTGGFFHLGETLPW
ncbi:MAG: short-chain dehydrogenase/reductase [Acidobacteriaceae bacterium]|nr:short-chain dehydrogenase/reductase [Acidobacteriaceae bacterium]